MNNLFLEGPIQTGKSTLIRQIISAHCDWNEVLGFTCQRLLIPAKAMHDAPTPEETTVTSPHDVTSPAHNAHGSDIAGFRLAPAAAPIELILNPEEIACIRNFNRASDITSAPSNDASSEIAGNSIPKIAQGIFKSFAPLQGGHNSGKPNVNLLAFETIGLDLMREAIETATEHPHGKLPLVLLDEIGGHELLNDEFRETLYTLLESELPCIGVIKLESSTQSMVSKLPEEDAKAIIEYNSELRKKITGPHNESGKILYFERGDSKVSDDLESFIMNI